MAHIYKAGEIRPDGFICFNAKTQRFRSPEAHQKAKEQKAAWKKLHPTKYDPNRVRKPQQYDPQKEEARRRRRGIKPKPPKMTHEEKRRVINKYVARKKAEDPIYRIKGAVRSRVKWVLKKIKANQNAPTMEILGCTWLKFKSHIESQFTDGMTWENHGIHGWHLDHIIPISCATTAEGVAKLSHYTNFQPKWAKENRSKSNFLELHH